MCIIDAPKRKGIITTARAQGKNELYAYYIIIVYEEGIHNSFENLARK